MPSLNNRKSVRTAASSVTPSNSVNKEINTVENTNRVADMSVIARQIFASTNVSNEQEIKTVETNNMPVTNVAQYAINNATTWTPKTTKPSIDLTEEQIASMSVRGIFYDLITSGRIKFTRAANETRKGGIPVLFHNKYQDDQMGRAFAYMFAKAHRVFAHEVSVTNDGVVTGGKFALLDLKGEQDRFVRAFIGNDGKVYYDVRYGVRVYNNVGTLISLNPGEQHKIAENLAQRVAGYNKWVDAHNDAVRARAQGIATPEQMALLSKVQKWDDADDKQNLNVQMNVVRHINADSIMNKYVIEALLLLDASRPAFEIYTRARNEEEMGRYLDLLVNSMERAFRNELRKLAGLIIYDESRDAQSTDAQ